MNPPREVPTRDTLVITGHPNHELAILGFVQRARPHFLIVTDGGQPARVAESRSVFESLGLTDRVRFFDIPENDLYRTLLTQEYSALFALTQEIRKTVDAVNPRHILCESIEFYNPLHDLALPLARAAARHRSDVAIFEFPLIAEAPGGTGTFRVQRPPQSRKPAAWSLKLTSAELSTKVDAGARRYPSLRAQMGELIDGISSEHAEIEYFLEAGGGLPVPGEESALRYEARGRALHERGIVQRVITFRDHFLPAAAALEEA